MVAQPQSPPEELISGAAEWMSDVWVRWSPKMLSDAKIGAGVNRNSIKSRAKNIFVYFSK